MLSVASLKHYANAFEMDRNRRYFDVTPFPFPKQLYTFPNFDTVTERDRYRDNMKNYNIPKWEHFDMDSYRNSMKDFTFPTIDWKNIMATMNYDDIFKKMKDDDREREERKREEDGAIVWRFVSALLFRGRGKHITFTEFLIVLAIYFGLVTLGSVGIFCMKHFCPNCCRKKVQGAVVNESEESLVGQQQLV